MRSPPLRDGWTILGRRRPRTPLQRRLGIVLLLISAALTFSALTRPPPPCPNPEARALTLPVERGAEPLGPICLGEAVIVADVFDLLRGRLQAAPFRPRADTPPEALAGALIEIRPAQGATAATLREGGRDRLADGTGPWALGSGDLRSGDAIVALDGDLERRGDRLVAFARTLVIERRAARPPPPAAAAAGSVRVVNVNLRNYFLTLGARGAASAEALDRQTEKWVATLLALDGDALALQEVENDDGAALAHLLTALNAAQERLGRPASAAYQAVPAERRGGDAIRVAIAYRPAVLTLIGSDHDAARIHERPPQAALFAPQGGGEGFTLITAHQRSKGGCPVTGDVDAGFGCWNLRRGAQSEALRAFAERLMAEGAPPALIVGDLNAYAHEPPVALWRSAGWLPLVDRMPAEAAYSYVFAARAGALDHAIAAAAIADRVTAHYWPVNADEPDGIDADVATPYRASDHDPLIVDVRVR
jgi:uncharacterized protein